MDGFNKESMSCGTGGVGQQRCPKPDSQYGYVPASETKPYVAMASQYVLADRMFTSNFDGSCFVSHQYIIAGEASSSVDFPIERLGLRRRSERPRCHDYGEAYIRRKISALLRQPRRWATSSTAAGVSWQYYTSGVSDPSSGIWSAYQAIKHIRNGHGLACRRRRSPDTFL